MPILRDTDLPRQMRRDSGFSLTELMIVVFIIGIVSSFILLTAMPSNSELEERVEDVQQLLQQSAQEAVISGQPHGAVIGAQDVRLVRRLLGNWVVIPEASVRIPLDIQMSFEGDGTARADGDPDIIFDPIGSASDARLVFDDRDNVLILTVERGSTIVVEAVDGQG